MNEIDRLLEKHGQNCLDFNTCKKITTEIPNTQQKMKDNSLYISS